jgi:cytochrome c oxidase subunit 2
LKKKITLLIAASILGIAMLSACGSNSSQANQSSTAKVATKKDETSNSTSSKSKTDTTNTTSAKTANASAAPTAGNVVEINENAKNFEYDKKAITVKKGDKVKITLHSDNGSHGLAIPAYNVNIQGNGSAEFTANKVGTFEFHCSVMCGSGHSNMTGKLIVQ